MIPTVDWTRRNFRIFNKMYFNNELPEPTFSTNRGHRTWGSFSHFNGTSSQTAVERSIYMANLYPSKYGKYRHGLLSMNVTVDRPEKALLGTLLHEMVHCWQFNNGHETDKHLRTFREWGRKLNVDGWDIARCSDVEGSGVTDAAIVKFNNFAKGIIAPKVITPVNLSAIPLRSRPMFTMPVGSVLLWNGMDLGITVASERKVLYKGDVYTLNHLIDVFPMFKDIYYAQRHLTFNGASVFSLRS